MTSDTSSEWLIGFSLKNWPYIVVSNFSWSVRKAVKTCPESGYLFSLSKWKNHCVHGLEISKSKNENFLHIRGTFYPERACQNMHLQKISPCHFFWSIAIWKCNSQNSHTWKMSEPVTRGTYWRAHGPTFRHLPSKNASHKKRKKCCEKIFFRVISRFSRKWAELYIYTYSARGTGRCVHGYVQL